MRTIYSPQVRRILREQRLRKVMAAAKPTLWMCVYLAILAVWMTLP